MTPTTHTPLARLTPADLAAVGLNQIAYVKPAFIEGQPVFAIHAADGTPLSLAKSHDVAFALVRQNDLEPVSTH
jgi:hypothetical protein